MSEGPPKDTGWAWMTVIAGFIMNFLVVGSAHKSFGILYVALVEEFNASSRATLSIVALSQSLCMLLGPVANALAMRFTSRRVVIVGGLLMSIGFILSMFPPNIGYLYFSYGLLGGIGGALAYSPTIVTVGQYFARRRALANGISVAGSGIGSFVVPPLIRMALDHYLFYGTMLIVAGLMLNVCVAGALLRPLSAYRRRSRPVLPLLAPSSATGSGPQSPCSDVDLVEGQATEESNCDDKVIHTVNSQSENVNSATVESQNCHGADRHLEVVQKKTSAAGADADSRACCVPAVKQTAMGCSRLLDWRLLGNTVFLVYAVAAMLLFTGYPPLYIMMPAHASQTVGTSKQGAAFFVSILGISDVIGRIGFGLFADFNLVPKRLVFAGCMSVAGVLICILPHINSYVGLAVMCAAVGLFIGTFFTLLMVVLAEKLGVHRLHSAFGLAATFMGVSFFYSTPITGYLHDVTGTWRASYIFCGVSILCGAAVLLLDPLAVRFEQNRSRRREAAAQQGQ